MKPGYDRDKPRTWPDFYRLVILAAIGGMGYEAWRLARWWWLLVFPAVALVALAWPREAQAQQAPEWRELGGVNGVELYEVRTGRATCYVTSAGGVSCK